MKPAISAPRDLILRFFKVTSFDHTEERKERPGAGSLSRTAGDASLAVRSRTFADRPDPLSRR